MEENFLYYIEHSIRIHWEEPALTDYQGQTHTFGDVAHHIARLHLLFEESGIRRGDKIALCSRNQTNWGIAFLAILSYGAVAVPILHEFKADNPPYRQPFGSPDSICRYSHLGRTAKRRNAETGNRHQDGGLFSFL